MLDSMTELCLGGEHGRAIGNDLLMHKSHLEAVLTEIGRGADLSECQMVDDFGLPIVLYVGLYHGHM